MSTIEQGLGPGRMRRKEKRGAKATVLQAKWEGHGPLWVAVLLRDLPGMRSTGTLPDLLGVEVGHRLTPIAQASSGSPSPTVSSMGY